MKTICSAEWIAGNGLGRPTTGIYRPPDTIESMTKNTTCNPYNCTDREGRTHRQKNGICVALASPKSTIRGAYEAIRFGAYTVFEDLNRIQRDYPKGWAEVTQALGGEPTQVIQKVNGLRTRHTFTDTDHKGKETSRKGWLMTSLFIIRRHIDNGLQAPHNYIETSRHIASFYRGESPVTPVARLGAIKLDIVIAARKVPILRPGLTPKTPITGASYGRRFHMENE